MLKEERTPQPTEYTERLICPGAMFDTFHYAAKAINRYTGLNYTLRRLTENESRDVRVLQRSGAMLGLSIPQGSAIDPANMHGAFDWPVRRVWQIGESAILAYRRGSRYYDEQDKTEENIRRAVVDEAAKMYAATVQSLLTSV